MKRQFFKGAVLVCSILALAVVLVFGAAGTSRAADDVIKIRYQGKWVGHEKQNWAGEQLKFAERVKAATSGKVLIENVDEVVRDNEVLDAVRRGTVDMGAQAMHSRGELALVNFLTLPFVEYEKMPEIYDKLKPTLEGYWDKIGVKQLGYNFFLPAAIFTKKPCTTLEELRSMKLRIGGNLMVELIKLAGGSPIVMNNADVYQAMQRGIIDGGHTAMPGYLASGWYEICKYISKWPVGSMGLAVTMNKDTWKKLNPTLQSQVMSAWVETEKAQFAGIHKDIDVIEKTVFSKGAKYANPSKAESDKLLSFIGPVLGEWKKKMGPDGQKVIQAINDVQGTNY